MGARTYGQYGGVATAVELIGERWALLIVRDLLVGPRRYTDLKRGLPRIPTNILSARLKELQDGGVVRRVPIRRCGLVYELTDYGCELEPIILGLARWGLRALGEPGDDDVFSPDSLTVALRAAFRKDAALPADYELRVGDIALRVQVNGALHITQLAPPAPPVGGTLPAGDPDITIAAGSGIRHLLTGQKDAAAALDAGDVTVVAGDPAFLERFATTFRIDGTPATATGGG
ncbi:transcriptional regulator [Microbacterium protaetiae]|uniref:Transcriptional regulator n=1 Tax=Microbacterium protaetiae TaxID=2509458 RepID=A0A4P6EB46_9MICO|nr:helix-turn-helix domain-containing protein [Microbacterium protaetiae]QAY59380.1 transcriptional regulator [Microbacterium protaetiae]